MTSSHALEARWRRTCIVCSELPFHRALAREHRGNGVSTRVRVARNGPPIPDLKNTELDRLQMKAEKEVRGKVTRANPNWNLGPHNVPLGSLQIRCSLPRLGICKGKQKGLHSV